LSSGLGQPQRHLRRNPALSVQEVVKRLTYYTQRLGGFGNGEAKWLKAIVPYGEPRMRRVLHRHIYPALFLRFWLFGAKAGQKMVKKRRAKGLCAKEQRSNLRLQGHGACESLIGS
jgi:hypothetical protein